MNEIVLVVIIAGAYFFVKRLIDIAQDAVDKKISDYNRKKAQDSENETKSGVKIQTILSKEELFSVIEQKISEIPSSFMNKYHVIHGSENLLVARFGTSKKSYSFDFRILASTGSDSGKTVIYLIPYEWHIVDGLIAHSKKIDNLKLILVETIINLDPDSVVERYYEEG